MAIKILIGGSPCTYWSIAQTNGRETKAEGMGWELFKNYLIAKEKFKPDFFLYENNKSASQAIKDQIAEEFGDIEQPEDRGILLKDILESGNGFGDTNDSAYCLTANYGGAHAGHTLRRGVRTMVAEPIRIPEYGDEDKSRPVNAYYSNNCGGFEHRMFNPNPAKQQVDMIAVPVETDDVRPRCIGEVPEHKGTYRNGKQASQQYRVYDTERKGVAVTTAAITNVAEPVNTTPDGKSQTIKAQYQNTSTVNVCCYKSTYGATGVAEPIRVGSLPRPNGELATSQSMQIYSQEGKSTTQMAGGGGLGGKTGLYAIPVEFEDGVPTKAVSCADGKTYTVYEVVDGKITIKGKEYPIKLKDGYYIIRKLTVRECARLQTMPDDYCKAVSDSQAYKALGNGWTAEVIIHLLNHALKDVPRDEEIIVLSMYDGIATGRYCLDKMGFTNVTYHAYEIDKYPIMVAKDNYPDIIEHGDAFAVREDDWKPPQTRSEWLDDLLGGAV